MDTLKRILLIYTVIKSTTDNAAEFLLPVQILCLESSWQNTVQRQTSPLYQRLLPDTVAFSQQLLEKHIAHRITGQFFMRGAPFYILIVSGHSLSNVVNLPIEEIDIQASDASLNLLSILSLWQDKLQHSLLILDSCYLGGKAREIQAETGAAGVFGFRGKVDWTASSIAVMLLLRHLRQAGVFSTITQETEDEQQFQTRFAAALAAYQRTMNNRFSQQLGAVLAL